MYEITGTVKVIMDAQTFDSGFTKREFVVETEEKYPQQVKIETTQDRVVLVENLKEGDRITVHFNIRGNEWKDRYFVNLQAWKVEKPTDGGSGGGAAAEDGRMTAIMDSEPFDADNPDENNLPF